MQEKRKTIGFAISDFRKIKKISQQKMATDLYISLKQLQDIEDDKETPDSYLMKKIAEYFDVPLSAILFTAMDGKRINDPVKKELFKAMKPVVESLIYFLMDATKPENKVKIKKSEISDN